MMPRGATEEEYQSSDNELYPPTPQKQLIKKVHEFL